MKFRLKMPLIPATAKKLATNMQGTANGPMIEVDFDLPDEYVPTDPLDLAIYLEERIPGSTFVEVNPQGPPSFSMIDETNEEVPLQWGGKKIVTKIVSGEDLESKRAARIMEVDRRTQELIDQGFEFPPNSGQIFSLSTDAQINLSTANEARELPEFVYPVEFNLKDDAGTFSVPNADTLHSMYLVALGTKRARLQSGTDIKKDLRAATDETELDAVVDNRS